jgi:hypothetical protein
VVHHRHCALTTGTDIETGPDAAIAAVADLAADRVTEEVVAAA